MKLILASGSKQRKDIFDMVGFKYKVISSDIEENSNEVEPDKYVVDLSKQKALAVANSMDYDAVVVASDTVIYMDGKYYEKPKSKEEAYQNIKEMSGNKTIAYTGVTIYDKYQNKQISFSDSCNVYIKELDDEDIKWYIENEENILGRCGYVILGKAAIFIDKVEGDYNTVFGISPSKLCDKLKELGYKISDFC